MPISACTPGRSSACAAGASGRCRNRATASESRSIAGAAGTAGAHPRPPAANEEAPASSNSAEATCGAGAFGRRLAGERACAAVARAQPRANIMPRRAVRKRGTDECTSAARCRRSANRKKCGETAGSGCEGCGTVGGGTTEPQLCGARSVAALVPAGRSTAAAHGPA
eukprot:scaffold20429_cov102-Isochrysis_galbana.AAC.5